jgi:hypothetical protein
VTIPLDVADGGTPAYLNLSKMTYMNAKNKAVDITKYFGVQLLEEDGVYYAHVWAKEALPKDFMNVKSGTKMTVTFATEPTYAASNGKATTFSATMQKQ